MTPELPRLLETELDDYALDALRSAARDRGSDQALGRVLTAVAPLIGAAVIPPPDLALPSAAFKASATWAAAKGLVFGVLIGSACVTAATAVERNSNSAGLRSGETQALMSRSLTRFRQRPELVREAPPPTIPAFSDASPRRVEPTAEGRLPPNSSNAPPRAEQVEKLERSPGVLPRVPERKQQSGHDTVAAASDEGAASRNEHGMVHAAESAGADPIRRPGLASELSREVRLVDEARRELASGNAAAALRALDRRERELSARALDPEASLVRVEALIASGQRARAADFAKRILAQNPHGPSAPRLRQLLTQFP